MTKLSTVKLKQELYVMLHNDQVFKIIDKYLPNNQKILDFRSEFILGSNWKRKSKLRCDLTGAYYRLDNNTNYCMDICGNINKALVEKFEKSTSNEKVWVRIYENTKSIIGSYFRLEIVSNPADNEIICWYLIEN